MRTCHLTVALCGLSIASACATSEDFDDSEQDADDALASELYQGIINGEPTTSRPAVVALFAKLKGSDQGGLCTGTIISDRVVLTAAHCVDPAAFQGEEVESFTVITEPDLTDGVDARNRLAVRETHMHPDWNLSDLQNGNDIAVAILEEPTSIAPIPYKKLPLTNPMMKIRMIGYGLDDGINQTGAGVKRQARSQLNSFDDKFIRHGQFFVGPRICNGDSGGPILAVTAGRERVIGVNSFGFIFCLGEASSTNVSSYGDFIESFLD